MKHDIEEDWGFLHSKEGLEENEMAGTTDGEEFCYSLNNTEEDSLEDIDFDAPLYPDFRFEILDFSICNLLFINLCAMPLSVPAEQRLLPALSLPPAF